MSVLLKNPSETASYRISVEDIDASASLTAAALTVPADLVVNSAVIDNSTTPKSVIVSLSGGVHGRIYQLPITINLSIGGSVVQPIVVRCWAS